MAAEPRLFLDIDVVEYVRSKPRREQERLFAKFYEIASFPTAHCDYFVTDGVGRPIGVHVFEKHAIRFWEDAADEQVKIVEIVSADRAD